MERPAFRRRRLFAVPAVLTASCLTTLAVARTTLPAVGNSAELLWTTNRPVETMALARSGTLYLGGYFTEVGPRTGSWVVLDEQGRLQPSWPSVEGAVFATLADGSGGWFIGGSFDQVGGIARHGLAHVLADGQVDPAWTANLDKDAIGVNALSLSGDRSTLYVGGAFKAVGGVARSNLAALDANTGIAKQWDAPVGGKPSLRNTEVDALALNLSGTTLFIGGDFSRVGGRPRNAIAAVDAVTGELQQWNPNADLPVASLAVSADEKTVYAGGFFDSIGARSRASLAALDAATGAATTWAPRIAGAGVLTVALSRDGSKLFVGGDFTRVGEVTRRNLAAIAISNASATNWNANVHPNPYSDDNGVFSVVVSPDGTRLYVAGAFDHIGGLVREGLAALDTTSGRATSWNAGDADATGSVAATDTAVAVGGGIEVTRGGFVTIGGAIRHGAAALDTNTGIATRWNPNPKGSILGIAVSSSGRIVYAAGSFTSIGGKRRRGLAALDGGSGAATTWKPARVKGPAHFTTEPVVLAAKEQHLYVTTSDGGVAAVDARTGALLWRVRKGGGALALSPDDATLFAGDSQRVEALRARDGHVLWRVHTRACCILALVTTPDGRTVYAAGGVGSGLVSPSYSYLAEALDSRTGRVKPWAPKPAGRLSLASDVGIYAVAVGPGVVYLGGTFESMGGKPHVGLAAVDSQTGQVLAWNPGDQGWVNALTLTPDSARVYVGGNELQVVDAARSG
jgi:hypothetical protein